MKLCGPAGGDRDHTASRNGSPSLIVERDFRNQNLAAFSSAASDRLGVSFPDEWMQNSLDHPALVGGLQHRRPHPSTKNTAGLLLVKSEPKALRNLTPDFRLLVGFMHGGIS